ncbi:MAG: hypothetical protein J0H74_16570 [Chitinophagaceae bacterium]|nr:hypothetical protein [Chitinophagaceae bacterium]
MSNFLRPGRTLPVLLLLVGVATFTFMLSGCGGGGEKEPPINEDSVTPHVIPLSLAVDYTKNFRSAVDTFNVKCPGFKDSFKMGHAEAFNSDSYRLLLKQTDSLGRKAAGIRIYYGLSKDDGRVRFVMVPYDVNGNDILKHLISTDEKPGTGDTTKKVRALTVGAGGAQALEQGQFCPPNCSPTSPLNNP